MIAIVGATIYPVTGAVTENGTAHPLELGTEVLYTIIDGQIVYSSKKNA